LHSYLHELLRMFRLIGTDIERKYFYYGAVA
jgi:hypothetical protein